MALVGIITGFILQRDQKKIRELERDNKKYKGRLLKALNAIQGYQAIEEEYAAAEKINVTTYRARVRKEKQYLFDTAFLTPNKVIEKMKELESE